MTEPTDAASLLPLVSREQLRAKKREEEEKSREEKRLLEEVRLLYNLYLHLFE